MKAKEFSNKFVGLTKSKNSVEPNEKVPEVGIFWVIDRDVFLDASPVDKAENVGGDFIVHPWSHYEYWDEYLATPESPAYQTVKDKDYDFYPRGRVVYDIAKDIFIVYADRCINKDALNSIVSILHIPIDSVELRRDEHYQCARCNKDYIMADDFQ